jgi:hypothetical protein
MQVHRQKGDGSSFNAAATRPGPIVRPARHARNDPVAATDEPFSDRALARLNPSPKSRARAPCVAWEAPSSAH